MPLSSVSYTGNGTQTDFTLTFPYIARSHVTASVNGVGRSFTWLTASTVRISPAPANGTTVKLQRTTPKTPLVDFADGDDMFETPLDQLAAQVVYITQEQQDQIDALVLGGVATLPGTSVVITPAGGISSINAQSALVELDTEKASLSGAAFTGAVSVAGNVTVTGSVSATVNLVASGAVSTPGLFLSGASSRFNVAERDGAGSFDVYADVGNLRFYSVDNTRDLMTLSQNGELNVAGTNPATQGIRDNGQRVHSRTSRQILTPQTHTTSTQSMTFAHTFGFVPSDWKIMARCLTADKGYSPGDLVDVTGMTSATQTITVHPTSSAINIYIQGGIAFANKGTGAYTAIALSSWEIEVWVQP